MLLNMVSSPCFSRGDVFDPPSTQLGDIPHLLNMFILFPSSQALHVCSVQHVRGRVNLICIVNLQPQLKLFGA